MLQIRRGMKTFAPQPFVIQFALTKEEALEQLRDWLPTLAPRDLKRAVLDKKNLRQVYIPFWVWNVSAHSRFQGDVGWYESEEEEKHTGLRWVKKFIPLLRSRLWEPIHGWHSLGDSHYHESQPHMQVYAAHQYRRNKMRGIKNEHVVSAVPFVPSMLSDKIEMDPFMMTSSFAWKLVSNRIRHLEVHKAAQHMLDGHSVDFVRNVKLQMQVGRQRVRALYQPAFIQTYQYNGRRFRIFINGVTGFIEGDRILSPAAVSAACVLLATPSIFVVQPLTSLALMASSVLAGAVYASYAPVIVLWMQMLQGETVRDWQTQEEMIQNTLESQAEKRSIEDEITQGSDNDALLKKETEPQIYPDACGYYRLLGLPPGPNTTVASIQNSFRRLAIIVNPNLHQTSSVAYSEAAKKYKELLTAYRVLRNDHLRQQYDAGTKLTL